MKNPEINYTDNRKKYRRKMDLFRAFDRLKEAAKNAVSAVQALEQTIESENNQNNSCNEDS